ncbi:MAG: hypothetical protein ACOYEP_04355 [Limnochordia bacterium]
MERVLGYLRRKLSKKKTVCEPASPESSWDWRRLAEALGSLEEELQAIHSLLQELSASPPAPSSRRT